MEANERIGITVKEAAELLGLSDKTVYTLTHRADFPAVRNGRKVIILRKRLESWLEAHAGEDLAAGVAV